MRLRGGQPPGDQHLSLGSLVQSSSKAPLLLPLATQSLRLCPLQLAEAPTFRGTNIAHSTLETHKDARGTGFWFLPPFPSRSPPPSFFLFLFILIVQGPKQCRMQKKYKGEKKTICKEFSKVAGKRSSKSTRSSKAVRAQAGLVAWACAGGGISETGWTAWRGFPGRSSGLHPFSGTPQGGSQQNKYLHPPGSFQPFLLTWPSWKPEGKGTG